jgi:membrane protease YdiL (CAAX protease family)
MVLAYVGTILFAGVLSCILFQNDRPELAVVLSDACILITTCIFGTLHWRCLAPQLRQTGLGHWETYVGILALAPMLLGNYLYFMFLTEMMNAPTTNFLEQIREQGSAFYLITLCVFPALTEEIAFRGLLQQWLQVAVTPVRALVIASALFSALHFSVLSAPYIFLLGLILGWTKLKTGSIYPAMAIHFLHNFIVVEWF